jgi:hypothetical protein
MSYKLAAMDSRPFNAGWLRRTSESQALAKQKLRPNEEELERVYGGR